MKKLKVNLMMVLALVIGVATMSFKMVSTATTYHYDSESTDPGAFANTANWKPGNSPVACGTGVELPCQITAENPMDLQSKLNGKTNEQVLDIVDSRRE
ncbi:hypothetical protein M3B46_18560 [Sphingobacterium daejeonense]|uniref:hypothetical protein n=1 Tax=Sphingobacterium daejeonense TaxID=371142 RepID=UPI0021A46032|nr:hypothetical protein [Sphingobacterium daejeonense]MCT1533010.1 hypothetical protein [Sphingobacterium daejeonense]